MFRSYGKLIYFQPYKLIVDLDDDLSSYYRSLIPKCYKIQPPKYGPHISVVRKETPPNLDVWCKYKDVIIDFEYDPFIHNDETYYWVNVYSKFLEEVRLELGLFNLDKFKLNGKYKFHITLGNIK